MNSDLLNLITNRNYNVVLTSLSGKKFWYDFAEEKNFDEEGPGNKSTRDRTLIKLLKSPGLMRSASGVSNTIFLPSDLNEFMQSVKVITARKTSWKYS